MQQRPLTVPADHPAFEGHFPGRPLWPGALLIDEVLNVLHSELALDATQWELTSAKFLRAAVPGASLVLRFEQAGDCVRYCVDADEGTALVGTLGRRTCE
jgi:3-hydroxymyristoyl/3-hydroxydecanoyl-(acyl carrier protein) dehydratase